MTDKTGHILLGEISGVFGVKGWVKVFSYTSPRTNIIEYKTWLLKRQGDWNPVKVVQGRMQGKSIVAQLDNVNDRNQAEALIGSKIAITSDVLDDLPEGEFYWKDLIGLTVKTVKNEELGIVDWLFDTGSNDVIMVKGDAIGEPERMIPFIMNDVVVSIDLEESLIVVDWDYDF